jgi:phosphate-selective porin OprO/OprP
MMRGYLKIVVPIVAVAVFLSPGTGFGEATKKKSVNERIIEILIENNVITKEQYEELRKLAQVEQEERAAEKPKVVAGFNKGFYIESADKQHKIKFDGRFHGDFKAYLGDHPEDSDFFIRRARLATSGTLHKHYDFRVEAEFGKGGSRLNDGFMNIHYWPQAQLKFGQFKVPFSMEELTSDNWIDFLERSLANKQAPSRDIGAMLHGGLKDELLYYQLGVFNGFKLNQTSDPDSGKDVALRLVLAPFKKSESKAVKGLRLGGAFTHGQVELTESQWWNSGDWKTAAGTTYLGMSNGVIHDGDRTRTGVELYWDWGSTALKGEYMNVDFEGLKLGNLENDFDIEGGYVSISHMLTGEKFAYKKGKPGRIIPLKKFKLGSEGWGALQLGARWEFVKADQGLLDLGYVDADQFTDEAYGFTVGLNWYPNEMVRFMLNYNHIEFDDTITVGGERVNDEDVILTRFEAVF